jgi:hypothetical protein
MDFDSGAALREWAQNLERAMNTVIGTDDSGAFALHTKSGAPVLVEPVPNQHAVVLSAGLGTVDDSTPRRVLQALLAANLLPSVIGPSVLGLQPQDGSITLRLIWTPNDDGWRYESFVDVLGAFGDQVDTLAASIESREIERLLPRDALPGPADDAPFGKPQFA